MPSCKCNFSWTQFMINFVFALLLITLLQQNVRFLQNRYTKLSHNLPAHLKRAWAPFDSNYLDVLESCCGWEISHDPYNATILWTRAGPQEIEPSTMRLGRGQLYSLVENTDVMTDKSRLHHLLASINATHLQPETYNMGNQKECRDFFISALRSPDTVWVSKEPASAQGEGIIINPNVQELREQWLIDPNALNEKDIVCKELEDESDERVLQRYIRNPLLLNGKKMEIRSYWLIASLDPYIIYYHDGTVRLTTSDYTDSDWTNPLIHITNTRQQKLADPNYYDTEAERKWNLPQLADYLVDHQKIANATQWLDNDLRPYLKQIIKTVAVGAWPYMMQRKPMPGWDGRFELLGMDVILDDDLFPWMTEVQMGPGISLDPGVKEKVIPIMLEEMTDLILEVDLDLRMGRPLSYPLRSAKQWHPLFVDSKDLTMETK